jgi:adenylosuccinate lyase
MPFTLLNLSPLDGRYQSQTKPLQDYFSEYGLIKYRLCIEVEYYISLNEVLNFTTNLDEQNQKLIRDLYLEFDVNEAYKIKEIEKITNHDVKAVEYYLKEKIQQIDQDLPLEFIHFGLTSEDINNLAFSLMWKDALEKVYLHELQAILKSLKETALHFQAEPMLSLTHGQAATPTTFGKEMAVFYYRLNREIQKLQKIKYYGKFGGATGNLAAHQISYGETDWLGFAQKFVESLNLEYIPFTTQIVPADTLLEGYQAVQRVNLILLDLVKDLWLYISRGILSQKKIEGEIGSSTMPHKINPINFENAEGNLNLSNSVFSSLIQNLPISRMQRDLSGSTLIRNQGVALGHSFLALKNIQKGLGRITVNSQKMQTELQENPEILAEAVQTILRKNNYPNAYEKLKELTRGTRLSQGDIQKFVQDLEINEQDKQTLLGLTPEKYIGYSQRLVEKYLR